MLASDECLVVYEESVAGTYVANFNFVWKNNAAPFEVVLYCGDYNFGIGCDYVAANMAGVFPHLPTNLSFTGNLTSASSRHNFYRNSATDTDDFSDFKSRRSSADIGSKNPGQ